MARRIESFLLTMALAGLSVAPAAGQEKVANKAKARQDRIEQILEAVATGEAIEGDTSEQVAILIGLVEKGDAEERELAMHGLARMKSQASAAVASLCVKLNDPSHSTRGAAADALVAIGADAVAPLRKLIGSASGRTRAMATHALSRLHSLDVTELEVLAKDVDPRVRAATADALSYLGAPAARPLAALLKDSDVAVAVEAARALQSNRQSPAVAIPALIEALSRAELGWAAANALAAYGIEARRAVPWIIDAYPLDRDGSGWEAAAAEALMHIGPPDELDIPQLCASLTHDDPEVRSLAATSLGLLGTNGRSAAPALKAAAARTIEQLMAAEKQSEPKSDDREEMFAVELGAAEECVAGIWHVTHDPELFLNEVVRLVVAADRAMTFDRPTPWREFSADDSREIEKLLLHENPHVRVTALAGVKDVGARAEALRPLVMELAKGESAEISWQAIEALIALGAGPAEELAPVLLARLREGTIGLGEFADAVGGLKIQSEEAETILEKGLQDKDEWTAEACAKALCTNAKDPRRIASAVMGAARRGRLTFRGAVSALEHLESAEETIIPILVKQLDSDYLRNRQDAASALGALGPKAKSTLSRLKALLDHESEEMTRLVVAKAIFLISGDPSALQKQFEMTFANKDSGDRYDAIRTIAEFKQSGAVFLPFVLAELRASEPRWAQTPIDALAAIGTPEAVAALEATAESTDWMLRSQATAALEQIGNPGTKEGN